MAALTFNAANEIAVDAFLRNRIGFLQIADIIEDSLNNTNHKQTNTLEDLLALDTEVRIRAGEQVRKLS